MAVAASQLVNQLTNCTKFKGLNTAYFNFNNNLKCWFLASLSSLVEAKSLFYNGALGRCFT